MPRSLNPKKWTKNERTKFKDGLFFKLYAYMIVTTIGVPFLFSQNPTASVLFFVAWAFMVYKIYRYHKDFYEYKI